MSEGTIEIGVRGMTCAACVGRVERSLRKVGGVNQVSVNLATERATIDGSDALDVSAVLEAVRRGGYDVLVGSLRLVATPGFDAQARLAPLIDPASGVIGVQVDGADVDVQYLPTLVSGPEVFARLQALHIEGFVVADGGNNDDPEAIAYAEELRRLERDLRIAMVFAIPLFIIGMGHMMWPAMSDALHNLIGHFGLTVLMFALATPVQWGPGLRFVRSGFKAAMSGSPDMNTLVMLGTLSAYSYSTVATFAPRWLPAGAAHVYFEAAAVVIALVLLGKLLEARARRSAAAAIAALAHRMPRRARVRRNGVFVEVDSSWLQVGDVVQVGPGEAFAVDGTIAVGDTQVDESMLTGESMPVARGPAAEVAAGTINLVATVDILATRVGRETTLARLASAVEDAQVARPEVQRIADRVAAVFVPIVLMIAVLTFGAWVSALGAAGLGEAVSRAVAVLVIACPCAMGLATPISIVVATGRAAELGIVFTDGSAMERLASIHHVFFDKTGTLTEGRPQVVAAQSLTEVEEAEWLAMASAAEASSSHPLARAIGAYAKTRGVVMLEAERHEVCVGAGLIAWVDGVEVRVGSEDWLGVVAEPLVAAATHSAVALDGRVVGRLAIADATKPGAKAAIAALKSAQITTTLLSGDAEAPARAVAEELGLGEVLWRCTPDAKAAHVAAAQARGEGVAFVGDGINDAAAIARADVGIAMGTGTDVAIGAAHVVLVSGDPSRIAVARALSKATLTNIRWNLVWAFGYNVVLIPLAAGALVPWLPGSGLSPVLAGAAMAFSSVFVVTNALRLRRFNAPADVSTTSH